MSSHFSPKSLAFYGTMIGSVLILFRIVSGYGETHLSAPPNISGEYQSRQSLPGCPESTRFVLTIQQSGLYLHGALRLTENSEPTASQASLTKAPDELTMGGLWDAQQLSLDGVAYLPASCQIAGEATSEAGSRREAPPIPITIQGSVSEGEIREFTGNVTLNDADRRDFTALRETPETQSTSGH